MRVVVVPAACLALACSREPVTNHDFSTPEGAILMLEDAYRARDIEAAVVCKDFAREAQLLLSSQKASFADDQEILAKTAEVLELAYRDEIASTGFPDLAGITCSFPNKETRSDGIVVVTEVCRYPDGTTSTQRIQVSKSASGWRVLVPLE